MRRLFEGGAYPSKYGSEFCFRQESQCFQRRSRGKHWDSRETKFTVPQGTSHKVIWYIPKQNKSKFWKTRWDSSDIRSLLITCNSGQHLAGNYELFSVWSHGFSQCCPLMVFGGKQLHCYMPCGHELANEWVRFSGKNASYKTTSIISQS